MIAHKHATKAAAAGSRTAFKAPVLRQSVRARVSTEEAQTSAPPAVDFTPNTQAVRAPPPPPAAGTWGTASTIEQHYMAPYLRSVAFKGS